MFLNPQKLKQNKLILCCISFNIQTYWKKLSFVAMSARYGVDLKLNYYRACEHLVVDEIIDLPTNTPISSNGDIDLSNFEFISCCN